MQGNTLVILGLVGLALVCSGLFVFVGLTLFRLTGHRLLSFYALLARDAANDSDADDLSRLQSPTPDLRAIAKAEDFDAALARHGAAIRTMLPPAPPVDLPSSQTSPPLGARRPPRSNVRRDDDDDLFGEMFEVIDDES